MKKSLATLAIIGLAATAAPAAIVINEVYGGGSNSGAPFNQDFVELFNNGGGTVDIGGWVLQYGTATGSFATVATIPSMTNLAVGAYYVIGVSTPGMTGANVPANLQAQTPTNMAASAGKVQILNSASTVIDLVGYGSTANAFEGTGPAPAPGNTTSDQRVPNGTDTNQNATDFQVLTPTPVPEPATWMLMGVGLLLGAQRLRRKQS